MYANFEVALVALTALLLSLQCMLISQRSIRRNTST